MPGETITQNTAEPVPERSKAAALAPVRIAPPCAEDAAEVHALIAACPPLDTNSLYANLIQCTHFAQTCALARIDGRVMGWISGHPPPGRDDTFFLWQVAVHPDARGLGLARRMLADILTRSQQASVRQMETSITRENDASWGLFRGLARWLSAPLSDAPWFDRDRHLAGRHPSEFLVTIGPFRTPPGNV